MLPAKARRERYFTVTQLSGGGIAWISMYLSGTSLASTNLRVTNTLIAEGSNMTISNFACTFTGVDAL
jgi:hypothetical protein